MCLRLAVSLLFLLGAALALNGCGTGTVTISPPKEGSNVISPVGAEIRWTGDVTKVDSILLDGTDVRPQFHFDYGNKIAKATLNANVGQHKIEARGLIPPICGAYGGSGIYGHVTFTVGTCPSGQQNCSGVCRNLQADSLNCGSCNNACISGKNCVQGTCQCPSGQRLCGGQCSNPCSPGYGYSCGVCTVCGNRPFGSHSGDDCQIRVGRDCPSGYGPVKFKSIPEPICVICGTGGGSSQEAQECL